MPRPLRLEFQDAYYHVMNRGANYQNIFNTNEQRTIFLGLLAEATLLFQIEIHAYCLMNNHYHLLVKTPRANLARAMRHINGVYTQRFNRIEKSDGPLFRGRYKAIVIDKEAYLLQVSRYIHQNPLKAKIIKELSKYKWSSYPSYLQPKIKPKWLFAKETLEMMNQRNKIASYKNFVESDLDKEIEPFYQLKKSPIILGENNFKKNLLNNLDKKKIFHSSTDYNNTRELPTIEQIHSACVLYFNLDKTSLYQGIRGVENEPRKIAMYGARIWGSNKLSAIADKFNCKSLGNVTKSVKEISTRIESEKKLAKTIQEIHGLVFKRVK